MVLGVKDGVALLQGFDELLEGLGEDGAGRAMLRRMKPSPPGGRGDGYLSPCPISFRNPKSVDTKDSCH